MTCSQSLSEGKTPIFPGNVMFHVRVLKVVDRHFCAISNLQRFVWNSWNSVSLEYQQSPGLWRDRDGFDPRSEEAAVSTTLAPSGYYWCIGEWFLFTTIRLWLRSLNNLPTRKLLRRHLRRGRPLESQRQRRPLRRTTGQLEWKRTENKKLEFNHSIRMWWLHKKTVPLALHVWNLLYGHPIARPWIIFPLEGA